MPVLLAASLFFTNPAPLEMPRATGYLVTETRKDGVVRRLEDRFEKFDLWTSRTVDGRWIDDEGRCFLVAHLDVLPPMGDAARSYATRADYVKGRVQIAPRDKDAVKTAVAALAPFDLPEKETRPRQQPRGYKDVDYWHGTNTSAIVCAYLPEKTKLWRLAIWELAEGDDFGEALKAFEHEFLGQEAKDGFLKADGKAVRSSPTGERELLRADAAHSVAAYDAWHVTDGEAFTVLDDLPTRAAVTTLTNDFTVMRRRYAELLPTAVSVSNTLAVARIFANREEYLDALETAGSTNLVWSAAYWCPQRREIVAHFGSDASEDRTLDRLRRTLRHEALHQYLSYATALVTVSPWLNEGYAQYVEDEESADWELPDGSRPTAEMLEKWSVNLPGLLMLDYDAFYAGSDAERRVKYRLAWSLAVFLEKGAPQVRFRPFANLKRDYFEALMRTRDMREATVAAFGSKDLLDKFVGEWLAFWKSRP